MSDYQKYFRERYSRMLLEQDFDISKEALDGIEDWKNVETSADTLSSLEDVSDDGVETLEVIDKDAWTEDDLQDSYDGKVILECVACHSRITVDQADVYEDEETQTACPDIMCPVCHSELGYTILGKIEKFNAPDEEEEEKIDFPEEEDEEDMNADWAERDSMGNGDLLPDDEDSEGEEEEEEEVHESLKTRLQRRRLGESKELDEKLPKNLSRSKDELRGKFGNDIDFENSTFDEISPQELAGMDRADRDNVIMKNKWRSNLSTVGKRGARSGKIIGRDWNNRDVNTGIDVNDPNEVQRYLDTESGGEGKIYRVNPVNKDPKKLAARKPNAYIGKANDARRNARKDFNANPERYSWNDPEQQRARDLKSAQGYRNTAADYMNQRFDDPDVKAYRQAKDSIKTDKSWKQYADNDVERNQDRVRSAELASQYGSRYANDIVDYERRAREYQAYADDARKKGLEHAKNMSDEERGYIARDLETANDRLERSKKASKEHQDSIDKTMADFKARHNKRMGKSESLNEATKTISEEELCDAITECANEMKHGMGENWCDLSQLVNFLEYSCDINATEEEILSVLDVYECGLDTTEVNGVQIFFPIGMESKLDKEDIAKQLGESLREGKDCEDCEDLEECGDQLTEAGNLHITDQKDMKRLGSKKWYSADNKKYFDSISKDNDIYVNPDKKTGAAKNKKSGRTYKFDKDNKPITDESLTEADNPVAQEAPREQPAVKPVQKAPTKQTLTGGIDKTLNDELTSSLESIKQPSKDPKVTRDILFIVGKNDDQLKRLNTWVDRATKKGVVFVDSVGAIQQPKKTILKVEFNAEDKDKLQILKNIVNQLKQTTNKPLFTIIKSDNVGDIALTNGLQANIRPINLSSGEATAKEEPQTEALTEAVNNLSLDTDDTHLEMTADENGRISVVSEPTNAPMEEVPDTAVQGEDSIVPLDMGDMAEVEDNISPDEQNEIMDAESEEPEVPAAEETEGSEGAEETEGSEGAEEPLESEEEVEVEAESFSYLGNTFAKKLYENVNSYKMTSSNEVNGKIVVEGVIKFNSGNSKKTRFIFDEAKETRTGRIVLEGINPTFYNGKAFKLKGRLNNGKLFCESLKYNYSIDNLNESTGKTEPIAIRGIVRSK